VRVQPAAAAAEAAAAAAAYGSAAGYGPTAAFGAPMGYTDAAAASVGAPPPGTPLPGLPPNTNTKGGPGHVLHVSVADCFYPVTIDILHTVFQPYGPVIRIVLVNKKPTVSFNEPMGNLQALVQFSDAALANAARTVRACLVPPAGPPWAWADRGACARLRVRDRTCPTSTSLTGRACCESRWPTPRRSTSSLTMTGSGT
jgi:hypothetical protein